MGYSFELIDHIGEIKTAKQRQIEYALEIIGLRAERYAKMKCPVDTGRLRNSISHTIGPDGKSEYIGTNVSYAPYQEMGFRRGGKHVPGKHFLRDAATTHSDEYKEIVERILKS